ncbi:hypothetical protein CAEBREN_29527, partial [Caenorhabditis brenneri]
DISEALNSLSLEESSAKDAPQKESKLIPLYVERYPNLFDTFVIICKNSDTGKLGMYVFEQYTHQFLHVVLPDIKYKKGDEPNFHKLILLTQCARSHSMISVQHDQTTGGLKKYQYNRDAGLFELMEDMVVIEEERDVEMLIQKILDEGGC